MRVLKLIFKNALRHKLRTSLTILGMAIAVMAFGVLRTVVDMYYEGLEATAANRLITRQSVSFIFPLPISYRDQIAKIPGVETVSFANWFGGTYKDKNNFFARMGADPETIFDVYPEYLVSAKELETFKQERNSCIIGSEIAKQYGFKIGDIIPLDGDIYPGKWEFVVRGIYKPRDKSTDATQMFFHWSAIDERMKVDMPRRAGNVMWYIIKIKDPAQAATISEQVDALFKNSSNSTKTETERAFTQGFISGASSLLNAMNAVSYIIIGIIMLVLGNTMIMSARERTCEYAGTEDIGFFRWTFIWTHFWRIIVYLSARSRGRSVAHVPGRCGHCSSCAKGILPVLFYNSFNTFSCRWLCVNDWCCSFDLPDPACTKN